MKYVQKSFGRGLVTVELGTDTIRYMQRTPFGSHSYEAPLSEYTAVVERASTHAWYAYAGGAVSAYFFVRALMALSDVTASLFIVGFLGFCTVYLMYYGRSRSGAYCVMRNSREPQRDIWLLEDGSGEFVKEFQARIRDGATGTSRMRTELS